MPESTFTVRPTSRATTAPATEPTTEPTTAPTTEPRRTSAEPSGVATVDTARTKGEVIARIGAAVTSVSAVHVDIGDQVAPAGVAIDRDYESGALDVRLAPNTPEEVEIRRIDGRLYFDLREGDGWQALAPDNPRLLRNPSGLLSEIIALDLLDDLRTTFVEGSDFQVRGSGDLDGITVDLYSLTLDVAALTQPSLILQARTTGSVEVDVAVGPDGRPVRIDYGNESGAVSSLSFSAWGVPVMVAVPPVR